MRLLSLMIIGTVLFLSSGPGLSAAQTRKIDHQTMERELNQYLTQLTETYPEIEFSIDSAVYPPPFEVPAGPLEFQFIPSRPEVVGSSSIAMIIRSGGELVNNQSIRVRLKAMAEVVVAARPLRRGEILQSQDLLLRYREVSRLKEPLWHLQDALGRRVKRPLRLGNPLQNHQIELPPLVKRGEKVLIRAHSHGLLLTAAGEARQDGRAGETIEVRNNSSRKDILCRVVAPGLVKVEF